MKLAIANTETEAKLLAALNDAYGQIKRLRELLDYATNTDAYRTLRTKNERLRDENERLRAALIEMRDNGSVPADWIWFIDYALKQSK